MRHLLLILLAACGTPSTDSAAPVTDDPRFDQATWPDTVGTDARPATVLTPSNYDGKSELPVIMMLHGYSVNAEIQDLVFQLAPRVDRYGFILILPNGTEDPAGDPFWNATEACCDLYNSGVNDVRYLKGVLDDVEAAFPVDPDRILLTGHSNGGFMSYRMACEDSDRIAAIAPLAGVVFSDETDCKAKRAVSVLHMHGTVDGTISYYDNAWTPGAETSLARWTDRAGCTGNGSSEGRRDYDALVSGKETAITRYSAGCEAGFNAELWSLEGVGHLPAFTDTYRDDLVEWLLAQRR